MKRSLTFSLEAYGVKLGINANDEGLLKDVVYVTTTILPTGYREIPYADCEHFFDFAQNDGGKCTLTIRLRQLDPVSSTMTGESARGDLLGWYYNQLHLAIGAFAVDRVFLHAAVVGWNGRAIILPGSQFTGKTTLAVELLKLGATYMSDEYALIDAEGLIHPFPKSLSIRGVVDENIQTDVSAGDLGVVTESEALPPLAVFLVEYEPQAAFEPERLGVADGIMALVSHTVSMRTRPAESLKYLNSLAGKAVMFRSKRGEAQENAKKILNFLENLG